MKMISDKWIWILVVLCFCGCADPAPRAGAALRQPSLALVPPGPRAIIAQHLCEPVVMKISNMMDQEISAEDEIVVYHLISNLPAFYDDVGEFALGNRRPVEQVIVVLYKGEREIGFITNADIKTALKGQIVASPTISTSRFDVLAIDEALNGHRWEPRFDRLSSAWERRFKEAPSSSLRFGGSFDASHALILTFRRRGVLGTRLIINPTPEETFLPIGNDSLTRMLSEIFDANARYAPNE